MIKLGLNYLKGVGVQQDHRKACYWLERSGEKGNAKGMYHAGKAWIDHGKHGNAVAYIWLFCSAQCGYEKAKNVRDDIGNRLGVESVVLLQNFSKPLLKKIRSGVMAKHLLIRAFNKLYKRDIPIPHHSEFLDDESLFDNSDALVEALKNQDQAPEDVSLPPTTSLEQPAPAKISFEESTTVEVKPEAKPDFTDNKMQ